MRIRHLRWCALLVGLVLVAIPGQVYAEIPPDARRAHDLFHIEATYDELGGHNHFSLSLYGPQRSFGWNRYDDAVTHVEVTTHTVAPGGATVERRFAGEVGGPEDSWNADPGPSEFTEGPCYPCGPYDTLFFALPHDFADPAARTVVDVRLSLPQAAGDCGSAPAFAACGGSVAGYVNPSFVGIPNPFNEDYGDAAPYPMQLR